MSLNAQINYFDPSGRPTVNGLRYFADLDRRIGSGGGLGGFYVDSSGDLILSYAGAAPTVTISPDGELLLEI
jgi:hypothetical protein